MKERRRFIRLDVGVDVTYTKCDAPEQGGLSYSKNISRGGICLSVNEKLKKSDLLDLKISVLRYEKPIDAKARVIWVKEYHNSADLGKPRFDIGVELIGISKQDAKEIEEYISGRAV